MKKISIIMPVYNVEKYIRESIESVINQTYKELEIILIDDESKDSSGAICDEYAKKDNRIKVIHQTNKGLSGARNTGLEQATGDYIMFIDSDDRFELNAAEKLLQCIEENNSDYAIGNYANMDEDGTVWDRPVFDKEKYTNFKLSIEDYDKSFYIMNSGVWNKIFRKSFLDSIDVWFEIGLPAEDAIFTTYCFIKSKNVHYTQDIVYNYRLRNADSISTNCSKEYFEGINKAYRIIYNNFLENDRLEYYRYFYAKSVNYILFKFVDADNLNNEERISVLDQMRWFYDLGKTLKIPTVIKSVKYIIESISQKDFSQTIKYCEILNQIRKMLPKEIKEKMSKPNAETYKEMEKSKMDNELLKVKEGLVKEMEENPINVLSNYETAKVLINQKKSIARFGDGELDIIIGRNISFQKENPRLSEKLKEILTSKQDFCMIGVPEAINSLENLTEESEIFWIKNMSKNRKYWMQFLSADITYGCSNITRPYIRYKDKKGTGKSFLALKELWKGRDVVLCEGALTRVGVGNDLLDECKSVKRVLGPTENAFDKYDELLECLLKQPKDSLIILALGPTATVLAYELAKRGYQAVDIGHLDIEYEWYLKHATKREKISYKYTNEVENGSNVTEEIGESTEYDSQIIYRIV